MYDYKWDDEQYQEVFGPKRKSHLGDTLVFITSIIGLVVVLYIILGETYGY
jgi:hypothetical protein